MFPIGPLAVTTLVGAGSVWLAWSKLRRVQLTAPGVARLTSQLKGVEASGRIEAMREFAAEGSWERRLAEELFEGQNSQERIINTALLELDNEIDIGAKSPKVAVYLAAAYGVLASVVTDLVYDDLKSAIAVLAAGLVIVGACLRLALSTRAAAKARRAQADALVDALLGPGSLTTRGRIRARRRRRRRDQV